MCYLTSEDDYLPPVLTPWQVTPTCDGGGCLPYLSSESTATLSPIVKPEAALTMESDDSTGDLTLLLW